MNIYHLQRHGHTVVVVERDAYAAIALVNQMHPECPITWSRQDVALLGKSRDTSAKIVSFSVCMAHKVCNS